MTLNPIQKRRIANFRANGRAFWSLWIFLVIFVVTLFAEFVANDKPLLVRFQGEWRMPVLSFYSEADFGGEFQTEAEYHSPEVRCLIATGGLEVCLDDPEGILRGGRDERHGGWQSARRSGLGALAAGALQLRHDQLRGDDGALAARCDPLARHR